MTQQKQKSDLTWLQCQLPRADWDNLNARRFALKLTWAEVIAPATNEYIGKLEAKATYASTEAPVTLVTNKGADEKTGARKTKRAKKASPNKVETANTQ